MQEIRCKDKAVRDSDNDVDKTNLGDGAKEGRCIQIAKFDRANSRTHDFT